MVTVREFFSFFFSLLNREEKKKKKEKLSPLTPSSSSSHHLQKTFFPQQVQGKSTPTVKNILTLDTCAPIAGAEVMSFKDEASLLRRWR